LSDISSPGEWGSKIEDIDRRNKECRSVLNFLDAEHINKQWKQQLREIQESRDILEDIREAVKENGLEARKAYDEEKATKLLHLLASDYQGNKDFNPPRVDGTCEWFFADERFRNWRDSENSRLLWVSAGPGCGKSVLSRALIDEKRLSTNVKTSTVCYFFFKDGDESRMYAHNALCAILHQLFSQGFTGSLLEQALTSYENFGETLTKSFSKLWDIFLQCSSTSNCGEIICLIDALDECQGESRKMLIDGLTGLYRDSSKQPSRLRFLVTSRPYDAIEFPFRQLSNTATYLRFDGDDKSAEIGHEINLVIDARVNEFAQGFGKEARCLIAERLKSMENRTYLWLHLTINIIKGSPSEYSRPVDIDTLLSSLPSEISEAYEKILERSKTSRYIETLLQILLAAGRPLSLEEANYALTLATEKERFGSHEALRDALWPPHTFKDSVKNLCGLFISVHDGRLSFIHQTAREFLLSSTREGNWQGRFTMPKSHSTLSSACLRYLLLPDLPADKGYVELAFPYKFLSYAATYWPLHYTSQDVHDASRFQTAALTVCCARYIWARYYFSRREWAKWQSWSTLSFASYLGLNLVIQELLQGTADNDMSDIDIRQALCLASQNGHTETVQTLLHHGADVNAIASESEGTALSLASGRGQTETVQVLLDHKADVNMTGVFGTALQRASERGYTETVQLLLDRGAHIDAITNDITALQAASMGGHTETVRTLLARGADVDISTSHIFGTALIAALSCNHMEIVQMLLNHGANVKVTPCTSDGWGTALIMASDKGDTETVQVLLKYGAKVNVTTPGNLSTALIAASARGHTEIVQVLLDHGADVNAIKGYYGTALIAASAGGYTKIVQVLLGRGADINATGGDYGTALVAAFKGGQIETVEVLLDNGADVNPASEQIGNELKAAAARGDIELVQMLLDHGDSILTHEQLDDAMLAATRNGKNRDCTIIARKEGSHRSGKGLMYVCNI
jgi:ankyrin repeat protein